MNAKIVARINNSSKGSLAEALPLRTPYSVHIDPCSLCNLKCKFCFQSDEETITKKGLVRGMMAFSLFTKIVDDLADFPDKVKKVKIGLIGEPTIHPYLAEMIDYVKQKQVAEVVEMFTNATLLNAERSFKYIDAGIDRINISIEGLDAEGYEQMTGVKVDMENLLSNIRFLYGIRKNCKIYIKTITQEKDKFYDMFGNFCDEIFVENIVPQWTDANKFPLGTKGMYGQPIKDWKEVCPFPFMYMHYNHDGTASGCTLDWAKEVLIGDANNETALEIWNGHKLKDLRLKMLEGKRKEIPFCDKCLAPMVCVEDDLDNDKERLYGSFNR